MSASFSRSLPARPDLAQQKKQAKELLLSFTAGDAEALSRVRAVLPDKQRITLADAQFTIAREYGFPTWAAFKQHIDEASSNVASLIKRAREAFERHDIAGVRRLLREHASLRAVIDSPLFAFDAPAIVAFSSDRAVVEVLLEFGASTERSPLPATASRSGRSGTRSHRWTSRRNSITRRRWRPC